MVIGRKEGRKREKEKRRKRKRKRGGEVGVNQREKAGKEGGKA